MLEIIFDTLKHLIVDTIPWQCYQYMITQSSISYYKSEAEYFVLLMLYNVNDSEQDIQEIMNQ